MHGTVCPQTLNIKLSKYTFSNELVIAFLFDGLGKIKSINCKCKL